MTDAEEQVAYECGHCETRVHTKILGAASDTWVDLPTEWVLVKCSSCKRPNVLGRECYGSYGDEDQWGTWRVYPPRSRSFGPEVPDSIRDTFVEAQTDRRVGSLQSTALMCRRSVELLANDQG